MQQNKNQLLGSKVPSENTIILKKDNHELILSRKKSYQELLDATTSSFMVRYSKNEEIDGRISKRTLLTRIYECYYESKILKKTSEQIFTYLLGEVNENKDSYDKFLNTYEDGIVYGVKEQTDDLTKHNFSGICFESKIKFRDLPSSINLSSYPLLNNTDLESAIMFNETDKSDEDSFNTNSLEIYKWDDCIQVIYDIDKNYISTAKGKEHLLDFRIEFPILKHGKLTLRELQSIIDLLESRFSKDEFISKVLEELKIFIERIKINEGLSNEENDLLSPKALFDKPFIKIQTDVSTDTGTYFEVAEEQFKSVSTTKKGPVKVIRHE